VCHFFSCCSGQESLLGFLLSLKIFMNWRLNSRLVGQVPADGAEWE
jgi:hypothetical protein